MQEEVISMCGNCMYAKNLDYGKDVICQHYGLVYGNGVCKKYKYNLFIKPPMKKRRVKNFEAQDFSID